MSLRDLLSVARDAALECVERRKPVAWVGPASAGNWWPSVFLALPMRTTTDWIVVTPWIINGDDHPIRVEEAIAIVENVASATTICEVHVDLLKMASRHVFPGQRGDYVLVPLDAAERDLLAANEAVRASLKEHKSTLAEPVWSMVGHALALAEAAQVWRSAVATRTSALFDLTVALLADAERALLEGQ